MGFCTRHVFAENNFKGQAGAVFAAQLLPEKVQETAMDTDASGSVDGRDSVYLAKVNFNLLRFIRNTLVQTVDQKDSNCNVVVQTTLLLKGDKPARATQSKVYFDFAHTSSSFDQVRSKFNFSAGSMAEFGPSGGKQSSKSKGTGLNGFYCKAAEVTAGVYACRLAAVQFSVEDIGLSVLLVTTDGSGKTDAARQFFLDGDSS